MGVSRFGFTLRVSLALVFGAVALVTTAILGVAAYIHTSRLVEADARDRLHDLLGATVAGLDAEAHSRIHSETDRGNADHARILGLLHRVKAASPEIRNIYTQRRDGGVLKFIVDIDEKNPIGAPYPEVTKGQLAAYDLGKVFLEPDLVRDRWGTWVTGTAPIMLGDKIEGVVGIDIAATRLEEQRRAQIWGILIACLLVGIGAVGLSVWLASRISKPLIAVEKELARLRTLELHHEFAVPSRIREIGNIGDAVVNMKNGLRSFRKYVPAELVADIIRANEEAKVSARHADLTIFFSDIAGFTSISEKLKPEEVVKLLERYLAGMSRVLLEHHGTIDKFIGDAVMGFWGAPREVPDHPKHACRAALACISFLHAAKADWERDGLPPVMARIGLHTGEVVVGNIGFDERLSYTIIGDDVNLASRLEGTNKFFGTSILISESTLSRAGDEFATRHLGKIVVKGREGSISVYELVGLKATIGEDDKAFIAAFDAAWDRYAARDFVAAKAGFDTCLAKRPNDKTTKLYVELCTELVAKPPGSDWSPAIEMTDK